mmetsp:Transcript_18619/g.25815  ORF Transcript_18619/g.25815 Transcript_18619/m.25815 type:complete len:433 (+) Transcript_18619:104-1402(+)|eukprot:CAMPEP_0196586562 /NCGR_PEP_ID=MMETSP1081-20130531/54761_1 /TAXON_ID=36882 /ORGANISM="Pyramimonas amylifera, Strain CCMP720" /LENGTH=432 /DNA_ID=CAMNT_0041908481 /DNA_START=104 /DNA_END=1402 /DNA_ORIENTATION=+
MSMTLSANLESPACLTIQLVANYCNTSLNVVDSKSAQHLEILQTKEGNLEEPGTICQYIASMASVADSTNIIGISPEEKSEVCDWVYRSSTTLNVPSQPICAEMNVSLKTRTFLVGSSLTLADLVVFGTLYPTVAKLAPAELVFLCNLTRWMDFIFNISGAAALYKALYFRRPQFSPPVELLAPPPAKEGKAGEKEGKAEAKEGKKGDKKGEAAAGPDSKVVKTEAKADANTKPETLASGAGEPGEGAGEGKKKEKKEKKPEPTPKEELISPTILDIRVGTIVAVERHPNADSLYLEKIDIGEAAPRQVVSGLVKFIPEERMKGARVLVLCNVKPSKMRDVESFGMVMCASNEDHTQVDFVTPPEGVPNGERLTFEGFEGEPEPVLNPKKKQFEKLAPDLKTNGDGVACYNELPLKTSKGNCKSPLSNAFIK